MTVSKKDFIQRINKKMHETNLNYLREINLDYLSIYAPKSYENFFVVKYIPKPSLGKIIKKLFTRKSENGILLLLPNGPEYKYCADIQFDEIEEGDVVKGFSFKKNDGWAYATHPIDMETFFNDIREINDFASKLEKALELQNIKEKEFERVKQLLANQKIGHEILNEILDKYKLKKDYTIQICAASPADTNPKPMHGSLSDAILSYIGQEIYKNKTPAIYRGKRIVHIDFPGWEFLNELVKEKCFGDKKQ